MGTRRDCVKRGVGAGGLAALAGNAELEQLEPRALMSVALSDLRIDDAVATPGQVVTLSVDVVGVGGDVPRAATFFRDVNGNGRWDSGVDFDLGAVFDRRGNTFERTFAIPADWRGPTRLVADAVGVSGQWSGGPIGIDARANERPRFESVSVADGGLGFGPVAAARVADDTRVRAVTFFLDRNNNGRWDGAREDGGQDSSLGTVFAPDGTGLYRLSLPSDAANWPRTAVIGIDVVDDDGDWSDGPRTGTCGYYGNWNSSPPSVSNIRVEQDWARTDGRRMTLRVDADDNSLVRAVTFFDDLDDDGRWTPGVDDSLGTVFAPSTRGGRTYELTVTTDFAGRSGAKILADATDFDDQWSPSRVQATARNGGAFVTEFEAHTDEGTRVEFEMKYVFPRYFNRTPPMQMSYLLFLDANKSGAYEVGVDRLLSDGLIPVDQQSGTSRARPRLDLGSDFRSDNWYGTAVTTLSPGGVPVATIASPVRIAVQRSNDPSQPFVTSFDAQVGSSGEIGVVGSRFTLAGTWTAPRGGSAVSFFWDADLNGRWDAGTDVDLGFQAVTGVSGVFNFTGTVTRAMVGVGSFTAVVGDVSNSPERWSQPVSEDVTQIFARPVVGRVTAPGGSFTVNAGSPLVLDVAVGDDRGVRAATAFIDTNNDGLFNGADGAFSATAFELYSGRRDDGVMRLSIGTVGLARGTYTVYIAVSDNHRGDDSASGGRVNGLWSDRFAVRVTVV